MSVEFTYKWVQNLYISIVNGLAPAKNTMRSGNLSPQELEKAQIGVEADLVHTRDLLTTCIVTRPGMAMTMA